MDIGGGNVKMAKFLQYQIALTIIEATDIDRIDGFTSNTNLGIALAASSTDMVGLHMWGPRCGVAVGCGCVRSLIDRGRGCGWIVDGCMWVWVRGCR